MSGFLALTDTLDNLVNGLRNLSQSLDKARIAYLLTPMTQLSQQALVTSPYFTNVQKRRRSPATVAKTPARRNKRNRKAEGTLITSPYFNTKEDAGPSNPRRRQPVSIAVDGVLPVIEAPDLWWEADTIPAKDSLSVIRYQRHSLLYYALWLVKPTLIQERVRDDAWKLLISVMLLNKTTGKVAIPIFWKILDRWSTPLSLSHADGPELMAVIRSLGLQRTRACRLILLSKMYIEDPPTPDNLRPSQFKVNSVIYKPTPVSHLPGSGAYALDSYRIFHAGPGNDAEEWKSVMPSDKELIRYLRWKWAFEEHKKWGPNTGIDGDVDVEYLERLPYLLQQ